jgi:hypothetical protein
MDNERRPRMLLIVTCLILTSVVLTLITLLWDITDRNKEREYHVCLIKYALGVQESGDTCAKYDKWIRENTNVKVPK